MKRITNVLRAAALAAAVFGVASPGSGQTLQTKGQPPMGTQPYGQQFPPSKVNHWTMDPTPWLTYPQVRQQLNLSNQQYAGLNQAFQNARFIYQKETNSLERTLPPGERQLNRLYWQYQGFAAFNDPVLAAKLNLTPAQRTQFSKLGQDWTGQMNKLDALNRTDHQQAFDQFTKMQVENSARINSVLTPEQQATWREMIGMPYALPSDVYLGPGMGPAKSQ
jgi:hypothetical protein